MMGVEGPKIFTVEVNATTPLWFYCAQTVGNHCQAGMSMVVNEPAPPNTLAQYQLNSKKTAPSGSLPDVQGGIISVDLAVRALRSFF